MERLRADELPAYTVAREVTCTPPCGLCGGTGRVPYDPQDVLRALAFLGVEEARWAVGEAWEAVFNLVSVEFRLWSGSLRDLLAKLPPHRLLVNSTRPLVYALDRRVDSGLVETKTHWPHDTPAEQWLLADAALAVALECLAQPCGPGGAGQGISRDLTVQPALDACAAWVEEPTRERLVAWEEPWARPLNMPGWIPAYAELGEQARALQAAARVIGEPRVREVVTASLLGRLL